MAKEIERFVFGGSEVEFDVSGEDIMINATEMGKIFGKKPAHFLENDQTKEFIEALSQSENSDFVKIVKTVKGTKNAGTWMHRKLALKFAGWLNARFELWVYDVIEKILFGDTQKIKTNHEQLRLITDRIKEIDQTASVIMKERYKLTKEKEVLEVDNMRALGMAV
jgi:phage anti-repressor protein